MAIGKRDWVGCEVGPTPASRLDDTAVSGRGPGLDKPISGIGRIEVETFEVKQTDVRFVLLVCGRCPNGVDLDVAIGSIGGEGTASIEGQYCT